MGNLFAISIVLTHSFSISGDCKSDLTPVRAEHLAHMCTVVVGMFFYWDVAFIDTNEIPLSGDEQMLR